VSYIDISGLAFTYEDLVMRFDLAVEQGTLVAIIGPSGAGKSTLLALIGGFEEPLDGRVVIGGRDITGLPPAERPVTTLFQDHNLFAHLTVAQNIGLGLHPGLRLTDEDRAAVARALAEVGLTGFEDRLPGQLSGGERQRVAIARALVTRPACILADEPTGNLDRHTANAVFDLMRELNRKHETSLVVVTHDVELAARMDRQIRLVDGMLQVL